MSAAISPRLNVQRQDGDKPRVTVHRHPAAEPSGVDMRRRGGADRAVAAENVRPPATRRVRSRGDVAFSPTSAGSAPTGPVPSLEYPRTCRNPPKGYISRPLSRADAKVARSMGAEEIRRRCRPTPVPGRSANAARDVSSARHANGDVGQPLMPDRHGPGDDVALLEKPRLAVSRASKIR